MIAHLLLALAPLQDPVRPHLEAALAAARWLETVAVEVPGGMAWPADPARSQAPDWTLYAGTPGVVLFLLELHAATGDERWLAAARAGADAMVTWAKDEGASAQVGLYTGVAGVALALIETGLTTGEERHLAAAEGLLDGLHARAEAVESGGRTLGPVTDVIAGNAGVGFLLLDSAARLGRGQDLLLAADLGYGLFAVATESEHGLDWPMSPTYARRMPNFSHGTAGVAAFLAAVHVATEAEPFLDVARRGAAHVEALARALGRREGEGEGEGEGGFRVHHHTPAGEELFYLGWCHGPTGTARLFRALHAVTADERWAALEHACARTLLDADLPDARPDGYWNNVGPCCGAAGVAAFLLERHRRAGGQPELALARALTADLVARGTLDEDGLRWEHAEHRVRPEYLSIQTGWMQGAAGIGHWLLTLDAFEQGRKVRIVLPDDRF